MEKVKPIELIKQILTTRDLDRIEQRRRDLTEQLGDLTREELLEVAVESLNLVKEMGRPHDAIKLIYSMAGETHLTNLDANGTELDDEHVSLDKYVDYLKTKYSSVSVAPMAFDSSGRLMKDHVAIFVKKD